MLRPGLGQRLQLGVGGLASLFFKIGGDGFDFFIAEAELPAQGCRGGVPGEVNVFQLKIVGGVLREVKLGDGVLDDGVDQQAGADGLQRGRVQGAFEEVAFGRLHGADTGYP